MSLLSAKEAYADSTMMSMTVLLACTVIQFVLLNLLLAGRALQPINVDLEALALIALAFFHSAKQQAPILVLYLLSTALATSKTLTMSVFQALNCRLAHPLLDILPLFHVFMAIRTLMELLKVFLPQPHVDTPLTDNTIALGEQATQKL